MSREVRKVPANWKHPKDASGKFVPLHSSFPYDKAEIEEGLKDGWLDNSPPHYGIDVMPEWPEVELTHLQMYETTTGGTPISPVIGTAEELAQWLTENNASAFAGQGASYQDWLKMIQGPGCAVSAVSIGGVLKSGMSAS